MTSFCSWIARVALVGLPLALVACSGAGSSDDDDSTDGTGDDDLQISVTGLTDGGAVSQKVSLQISASGGGGITALSVTAPAELVGADTDAAPDKLAAVWDTTQEPNGSVQVTVTATGVSGASRSQTFNVTRNNPPAALAGKNYEDGSYVRHGAPLLLNVTSGISGLKGLQVSRVTGGGLSPGLPVTCTTNLDTSFTCNVGSPTEGTVDAVINAITADGQLSEPLLLHLVVLRDDVVSAEQFYDFELSPDGKTGVVLARLPGNDKQMRVEFINMNDPAHPVPTATYVDLDTGVSAGSTGTVGNILMPQSGDKAYVIFPSSKVYEVQLNTFNTRTLTLTTASVGADTGTGINHANRAPFSAVATNGSTNYIFAVAAGTPSLIVINATSMSQVTPSQQGPSTFIFPATTNLAGFGYMTPSLNGAYLYMVNNFGNATTQTADLAVFDLGTKKFVDYRVTGGGGALVPPAAPPIPDTSSPLTLESTGDYKIAQQPAVTPDGAYLVVPLCSQKGGTQIDLLSLQVAAQTDIKVTTRIPLTDIKCGTVASVSPNGRYVLISSRDPAVNDTDALNQAALIDLSTKTRVSATFNDGAMDGTFSPSSSQVFTESCAYTVRTMGSFTMGSSTVADDLDVPSAAGLVTPASQDQMRTYNHMIRGGNYIYQMYAAQVPDGSGGVQSKGSSLSIFDISKNAFIFPVP